MVETLIYLLAAHFLCDYPLQGDYMAQAKNRHTPAGANGIWTHVLVGHAIIHGAAVLLITGSLWMCLAEIVIHGVTDLLKCEKRISYHVDQAIHIACKVLWVVLLERAHG